MDTRKIFISYAREDQQFASRLERDLEKEGVTVWIDEAGIEGGQDWTQKIDDALRECTEFVVILSPDSRASEVVQNELILARHRELPVRPVLYRSCEPWLLIASTQYIDFTESYEEGFQKLMKRPAPQRTSWRKIRIFLKKVSRPLLAVLALGIGIAAFQYFFSPSNTTFSVSGPGDKGAIAVSVHNRGSKPSTLISGGFKLHFGNMLIATEPLVLQKPETHSRIAGHGDEIINLRIVGYLTPKKKSDGWYLSREDVKPLLPNEKFTLTAQVTESDDRIHTTTSEEFPGDRIQKVVLEAYPDVPINPFR